jgi:hypothetical protein
LTLNNYVAQHRLFKYSYNYNNVFDWNLVNTKTKIDPLLNLMSNHNFFYPVRVGYIPKRLAMWQLLMILKMWHHLVILLWWALYIYRLGARKKNSYSIIAVCYFNVYCCYILGILIYLVYFGVCWEIYMKIRPTNFSIHRFNLLFELAINYITRGLIYGSQDTNCNEIIKGILKI